MLGETQACSPPGHSLGRDSIDRSAEPVGDDRRGCGHQQGASVYALKRIVHQLSLVAAEQLGRRWPISSRMRPSLARASTSLSCEHSLTALSRLRFSTTARVLEQEPLVTSLDPFFESEQRSLHRRSHRLWARSFDRPRHYWRARRRYRARQSRAPRPQRSHMTFKPLQLTQVWGVTSAA